MSTDKQIVIEHLKSEIETKQKLLGRLEAIDFDKPCSETEWHDICDMSVCTYEMLEALCKKTFPECEIVGEKEGRIAFKLYGFYCYLPISREKCIEVDTQWWRKDKPYATFEEYCQRNEYTRNVYEFFQNKNTTASDRVVFTRPWDETRTGFQKNIIYLIKRTEIEQLINQKEKYLEDIKRRYDEKMNAYDIQTDVIRQKREVFTRQLMPELLKFTEHVVAYADIYANVPSVEDVLNVTANE